MAASRVVPAPSTDWICNEGTLWRSWVQLDNYQTSTNVHGIRAAICMHLCFPKIIPMAKLDRQKQAQRQKNIFSIFSGGFEITVKSLIENNIL